MPTALLEAPLREPVRTGSRTLQAVRRERRLGQIRPLIVDGGCDVHIGGAEVSEALRIALLAWLPLDPDDVAAHGRGLLGTTPAVSIAYLVRPPVVWSLEEAARVARRCQGQVDVEQLVSLHRYARGRVEPVHRERLRSAAARVAAQLSLTEFSRGFDDETWDTIASTLLVRYGLSASAARAARTLSVR